MPINHRDQSVKEGRRIARLLFAIRGNHSEAHLSERDLAVMLAYAFECGSSYVEDGKNRLMPVISNVQKAVDEDISSSPAVSEGVAGA